MLTLINFKCSNQGRVCVTLLDWESEAKPANNGSRQIKFFKWVFLSVNAHMKKKKIAVFVSWAKTHRNLSRVEYFRLHTAVSSAQYVWFPKSVQPEKYAET